MSALAVQDAIFFVLTLFCVAPFVLFCFRPLVLLLFFAILTSMVLPDRALDFDLFSLLSRLLLIFLDTRAQLLDVASWLST